MNIFKRNTPAPVQDTNESNSNNKENKIGQPMLLPIFFCLVSGLLLILLENLTMM